MKKGDVTLTRTKKDDITLISNIGSVKTGDIASNGKGGGKDTVTDGTTNGWGKPWEETLGHWTTNGSRKICNVTLISGKKDNVTLTSKEQDDRTLITNGVTSTINNVMAHEIKTDVVTTMEKIVLEYYNGVSCTTSDDDEMSQSSCDSWGNEDNGPYSNSNKEYDKLDTSDIENFTTAISKLTFKKKN